MNCTTSKGAVGVTTPSSPSEGSVFGVVDVDDDAAANNITVTGSIDGEASLVLATDGACAFFIFDGGEWKRLQPMRKLNPPVTKNDLRFTADGAAGPSGPPGPGDVLSGAEPDNVATITATTVETDATANADGHVASTLYSAHVPAGSGSLDVPMFITAVGELLCLDVVATCKNASGTQQGRFNVRAKVQNLAGTVSLISGGSDPDPDSSNTADLDFQIAVDFTGVVQGQCIASVDVDLIYFWEVRAQVQP